jgi:Pilus formation protein N terminal region/GYF domain 2
MQDAWYYADRNGKIGPLSIQELRETLCTLSAESVNEVLVWRAGFPDWKPARDVGELNAAPPPLPPPLPKSFARNATTETTVAPQSAEPATPKEVGKPTKRLGANSVLWVLGISAILIFLSLLFSNPNSHSEQSKIAAAPLSTESGARQPSNAITSARAVSVFINGSLTISFAARFKTASVASTAIADIRPLTDHSLYVVGKKIGTTDISMFDQNKQLVEHLDLKVIPWPSGDGKSLPPDRLVIPINKSQTVSTKTPFAMVLVASPAIADIRPLSDHILYIVGRKIGMTDISMFDQNKQLIKHLDLEIENYSSRPPNRNNADFPHVALGKDITPAPPPQQIAFKELIEKYKEKYNSASTELQKTNLRFMRRDEMCLTFAPEVKNWIGVIYKVRSDYDRDARLTVQAGPDFYLDTTWSYEIGPKSRLFPTLLTLDKNDYIMFSGTFEPDRARDCFVELSLTEWGGMTEPEFRFHFSSIEKLVAPSGQ